jgi:THO complex subunit 3
MLVIEHRSDLLSSDQKLQEQLHRIDKNVVSYAPHTRSVNCLAWNALGSRLASCSADESFKVWDLETTTLTINSKRETFAQKTKTPLEQVCWSRTDPDVLFVSGAGDTLCVWDIRLKTIAKSFKCKGASLFMACSPDSK